MKEKKIFCDLKSCLGCKACEIACAVEHSKSKDLFKALAETRLPHKRVKVGKSTLAPFPIRCQHCKDAACITACISGAMYKDKSGRTAHDAEKCVGCCMCIMACPFGAVAKDNEEKTVFKCDLCPDRDLPACVEACPTKALFFGTLEEFKKHLNKKRNIKIGLRNNRK